MRKIYTFEECKNIALQYTTRKELKEKQKHIYTKINRNKWGKELFSHMKRLDGRDKDLSYEGCKTIVSHYEFLKDFREKETSCYVKIIKEKWYDLLENLKQTTDNVLKRYVYAYEFPEYNSAYIGVTYSIKIRDKDHHKRGTVFKFTQKNNINNYKPIILLKDIPFSKCKFYEDFYIKKYKKNGWNLLNIAPAGSLGGTTLVNDNIICFNLNGEYVSDGKINKISKELNIPIHLIRKCLRKENKSTNNYCFITHEEWVAKGSPKKIEKHIINNQEEKIAILDKNCKLLHVCKTKTEAKDYCNIKSSCNNIVSLKHFLILNVGKDYKCCYYEDYIKYTNGEYVLHKPNMPKCKKIVFVPNNITNINEFVQEKIKTPQWEINRLEKRRKRK